MRLMDNLGESHKCNDPSFLRKICTSRMWPMDRDVGIAQAESICQIPNVREYCNVEKEEIETSNYHLLQQFLKTDTTKCRGEMPPSCFNFPIDAKVREHSPINLP